MARRSDHSKDELKEIILQATLDIVESEGFHQLNARKIADNIGYTVGTLYHVFKNLDDIILHVNAQTLDLLTQQMATQTNKNIHALVKTYVRLSQDYRPRWHMLCLHTVPSEKLPNWYRKKIRRCFQVFEQYLTPVLGKKAADAAQVLWAGIHGILLLDMQGKLANVGSKNAELLIHSLTTHYLEGMQSSQ